MAQRRRRRPRWRAAAASGGAYLLAKPREPGVLTNEAFATETASILDCS